MKSLSLTVEAGHFEYCNSKDHFSGRTVLWIRQGEIAGVIFNKKYLVAKYKKGKDKHLIFLF